MPAPESPPPDHPDLGPRLRALRVARGLTQGQLAQDIGVSRSAVAQWETGRAGQATLHLRRVADALGVSVDRLLRPETPEPAGAGSADERALLALYRAIRPTDRQLLLLLARRLAVRDEPAITETFAAL